MIHPGPFGMLESPSYALSDGSTGSLESVRSTICEPCGICDEKMKPGEGFSSSEERMGRGLLTEEDLIEVLVWEFWEGVWIGTA